VVGGTPSHQTLRYGAGRGSMTKEQLKKAKEIESALERLLQSKADVDSYIPKNNWYGNFSEHKDGSGNKICLEGTMISDKCVNAIAIIIEEEIQRLEKELSEL